ncbi:Ribosome inactivating protein [Streptomyces sp. YIM 121038]|uniref:ribosome-inactivating family protein n=1 Tax=Streptomyces sp. YIM 121038 TaxID=2136401 RepID=UPI00111085A5|nr:ribosome-inactivating family protein [Streptomyces sp. YIM 121038]QCX73876.1 Ribosome inactivating protein [Streptomyces sp. YIM 121038]
MQPILALRRAGRRLSALCFALLATCTLVNAGGTPAHADTSEMWTKRVWDISDLARAQRAGAEGTLGGANSHAVMVGELRRISSHPFVNGVRESMPEGTGRYIELQIHDETASPSHRLSLYLRADNLYLDGFTVNGQNYRFNDAPAALTTGLHNAYNGRGNLLFRTLPYSGHYADLANAEARGAASFEPSSLYAHLSEMMYLDENHWNSSRVRRAIANVIAATSEAARFGWIENRIYFSLLQGGQTDGDNSGVRYSNLGSFGVSLENNWARLSRLAHREANGNLLDSDAVTINNTRYQNLAHLRNGVGTGGQRIAPLIALYGAR